MENGELNVINTQRCANLRWKGLFIDATSDPFGGDHIFWCLKTQIGLGPDGQIVGAQECGGARGCFEEF